MIKVIENFITDEEQSFLMGKIPISDAKGGKGRTYTRFGSIIPYNSKVVSMNLPDWSLFLIDRLKEQGIECDSVCVNQYNKGQYIGPHVDSKESGPIISVLSLGSLAVMGLTNDSEEKKIDLPPKSLLMLSGPERWIWKHFIYPLEDLRFSIVFRKGTPK